MSKKGKISNNYSVEPLEPRFMLSATAEDAAVDWINQQLITEITTSINLSESESVKHNGSNLSINDLISGSFALTSSDVQLTKQGNTDYYDVLLSDDINFESISLNNLSVDVGGHTISGLNGLVNTSISFDGLQLEIIEDDGNFSVSSKQYTDISLNSQISIDEAANAGLNDGYLGLVEQTDSLETSADIEIDVAANQSNSSIDLSFDLEFDTATNSIVTFNPDMKVTSASTVYSYDGLTFRDSVDQSIRRIEEAFDFFKDGTSEFINGVKVGNTVVEWNSFAEIIRHYAAAAYVARQVAASNSTDIGDVFDEILDKTSWNTFDDISLTISSNQLVLKKTFNGNLNFDLLNVSAIPVDMEIILNLSDSGVTVDKISASISETGISFDTNFGLFDGHVENASVNFDLDVVFRDGEYSIGNISGSVSSNAAKIVYNDASSNSEKEFVVCDENSPLSMEYDSDEGVWKFSSNLNKYTSITGLTVANEFEVIIRTIDGAVQKMVAENVSSALNYKTNANILDGSLSEYVKFLDEFKDTLDGLTVAGEYGNIAAFVNYDGLNSKLQEILGDTTKQFVETTVVDGNISVKINFSKTASFDFSNSNILMDLSKAMENIELSSNAKFNFTASGNLGFTISISFDNADVTANTPFTQISQNSVLQNTQALELVKGEIFLPHDAKWTLMSENNPTSQILSPTTTTESYTDVHMIVSDLNTRNDSSPYTYSSIDNKKIVVYSDSIFSIQSESGANAFSVLGFSNAKGHWARKITGDVEIQINGVSLSLETNGLTEKSLADYLNEQLSDLEKYKVDLGLDGVNDKSWSSEYGLYAVCLDDNTVFVVCDSSRANFSIDKTAQENLENNFKQNASNAVFLYISSNLEYKSKIESSFSINLGNDSITINNDEKMQTFSSLSLMAKELNKELAKGTLNGKVVAVVENDSIILRTSSSENLSAQYLSSSTNCPAYADGIYEFKINDEGVDVDLSSANTINDVCNIINVALTQLQNISVQLAFVDGSFKFSSTEFFTIASVLDCDLLKVLGFGNNAVAVKYGNSNDYVIKGASVGCQDLTNRFKFSVDELDVDLVGRIDRFVSSVNDASIGENTISFMGVNFEPSDVREGSFLKIGNEYFKVQSLIEIDGTINGVIASNRSVRGKSFSEEKAEILLEGSSTDVVLVSDLTLNANFVEASVFASGGFALNVSYPQKTNSFQTNNNDFLTDLLSTSVDVSGSIDLDGYLTIGNHSSLFNIGCVAVSQTEGLDVSGLSIDSCDLLKNLDDFSIETVLSMLENIAKQAKTAISKLDVSIPLVNKRVNDIVKVGENLSQIVAELRNSDALSVQTLQKLVNKFLLDASFIEKAVNYSEDNPVYVGGLVLSVNALNQLEVSFSLNKFINESSSFSLGKHLSGAAKLVVSGGISVDMKGHFEGTSFKLDREIYVDANLDLTVDKPSFDLSIPELNVNGVLHVGTNKNNDSPSSLNAKFIVAAGIGDKGETLANISGESFGFGYAFDLEGELFVYVGDSYLGNISIDKYIDGVKIASDLTNLPDVRIENDGAVEYKKISQTDFVLKKLSTDPIPETGAVFVVDISGIMDAVGDFINNLTNGNLYEKLKLAVSGLDSFLDIVDTTMNDGLANRLKSLPVAGNALSAGADFIEKLHQSVIDPLANLVYSSPDLDAKSMASYFVKWLESYINLDLIDSDDQFNVNAVRQDWTNAGSGVYYRSEITEENECAEWFFTLADEYKFGTNLDFDLGFPGLGLKGQGGVGLSLLWQLNFGIGISQDKGFYLILPDGDELKIKVNVKLNETGTESTITGRLAGLGAKLSNKIENSIVDELAEASLNIDLNKNEDENIGVETKSIGEILSNAPSVAFDASVELKYAIEVGVIGDNDVSAKFPNITGIFEFAWGLDTGVTSLGFSTLKIDLGTFVKGTLGSVISKIRTVLEPVEPIIEFLTSPFPVLDDLGLSISPLDLAKMCNPDIKVDFIYAMQDLLVLANRIKGLSDVNGIALPDLQLFKNDEVGEISKAFLEGSGKLSAITDNIENYFDKFDEFKQKYNISDLDGLTRLFTTEVNNSVDNSGVSAGFTSTGGGWEFFWDNPTEIYKLLLGEDIMLVKYNMPELEFNFNWDQFFPVVGPLGVRASVTFGAKIDFTFGYDTLGIRQWVKSDFRDVEKLMNGFYLDNSDGKPELTFYGGLGASAELNVGVKAGVGGGVDINIYLDAFDPNKDDKLRIGEIKEIINELGALSLFDVRGEITAQLSAYIKFLFYTKRWDITSKITLFSFDVKNQMPTVWASESDGNVIANVGDSAESRIIDTSNRNEKVTYIIDGDKVSWEDGSKKELQVASGKIFKIDAKDGSDQISLKSKGEKLATINILIDAGEGDDVIDLSGLSIDSSHYVIIVGGAGKDKIRGAKGKNIVFGDNAVFVYNENGDIVGIQEVPVDSGNSGDDYIDLSASTSENIVFGGAGNDQILGGTGNDILVGDGGKISVNFDDSFANAIISHTSLSGEGGNDIIYGNAGSDRIYGGAGNDSIDGGAGDDVIHGEKGDDRIGGGSGNDELYGEAGMDVLVGDSSDNLDLSGLFGSQIKSVIAQEFLESYKFNSDNLSVALLSLDTWFGVTTPSDSDMADDDRIYGGEGQDVLIGRAGNDHVEGGIGNDIIHGGSGNDKLYGGLDNDVIYGGLDSDLIYGESGNDTIYGDNGLVGMSIPSTSGLDAEITFGINLGLLGKIYPDAQSELGNDDQIFTGSGMDFVDGQGGNDEVTVEFMGDSTLGYANVFDSGESSGDTLIVNGTNYNDKLLVRASEYGVGFVALVPNIDIDNAVNNTNLERVNFSSKADFVQLNTGDGNDRVSIDGTVTDMSINGGAGNDSFQIGQLYESRRNSVANVAENDLFNTVRTSDGYLSEGVGQNTSLTLNGEEGEDNFNLLHSVGDTNMFGGADNDTFTINGLSYDEEPGKTGTVENGSIGIDGGAGIDKMIMNGTRGDDTFVLTDKGLISDIAAVDAVGVEETLVNAGDGDDLYYVISSKADNAIELNGGNGNDTVAVGGMPKQSFKSTNVEGMTETVTFAMGDDKIIDSFTIVDTEEPVVFLQDANGNFVSKVSVVEGQRSGAITVGYAGNLADGEEIEVTISIPRVSKNALQSGNRGIGLSKDGLSACENTITLRLTSAGDSATGTFYVHALSDLLAEGAVSTGLIIKSRKIDASGTSHNLKQVSMTVEVSDESASISDNKGLIAKTSSYNLDVNNPIIELEDGCAGIELVFIDGLTRSLVSEVDYSISGNSLTITNDELKAFLSTISQPTLYVHYRLSEMAVSGSSISLAYSSFDENEDFCVMLDSLQIGNKAQMGAGTYSSDYYYVLSGSTITFYSATTQRQVAVNGNVSVVATKKLQLDSVKPLIDNVVVGSAFSVRKNQIKIYESTETSKDDADASSCIEYTITLAEKLTEGETADIVMHLDELQNVYVDGAVQNADGSYTIHFEGIGVDTAVVRIYALNGCCDPAKMAKKVVPEHTKDISEIRGNIVANGFGEAGGIDAGDTIVLTYNHKLTNNDAVAEPESNTRIDGDVFGAQVTDDPGAESGNVDRIIINNQESSLAFSETTLESVNDAGEELNTESLLFTNSDLAQGKGITANEMEFAEFNLGKGKDQVDISKTLYREDGFQTFTVVNTGDANDLLDASEYDDQVVVESYGDKDGTLVLNTQGGKDKIVATSDEITKDGIIAFGGNGSDEIDVAQGVIAFGDKGNVLYKNAAGASVTNLGYDIGGNIIYTRVEKDAQGNLQKQTDGVARGASSIKSVQPSEGNRDIITAGGKDSVVVGGYGNDDITINGANNVILGDNGEINYSSNETTDTTWNNQDGLESYISKVKTIENGIGDVDNIEITGSENIVMGGDKGDFINIGESGVENSGKNNVVLGDGGEYEVNNDKTSVKVTTDDDSIGGADEINVYGGGNIVMGGAQGDEITIGESASPSSNENVVLGDAGRYELKKNESLEIQTKNDSIGGVDSIKIYGGDNVAMGGAFGDTIEIVGTTNVVLGDGGLAEYDKSNVSNMVNSGLQKVETQADAEGGVDDIDIHGDRNVVMGGAYGDEVDIDGADNVVVGDGGKYQVEEDYRTIETRSEHDGGHDTINTGNGRNVVMGGMDSDEITTGNGNDIILGDGGFAKVDNDFNALMVSNEGYNVGTDLGTAGADDIDAGNGDNVVFGGLDGDDIRTGTGKDVVFGDNGFATFRGNAAEAEEQVTDTQSIPETRTEATLSFNFMGASQTGLSSEDVAGAADFAKANWNNVGGSLAGTYGNDDREIVRFDDNTRASAVSVSYGGIESHRNTSTDNRINLQAYGHNLSNASTDADAALMNSGYMTTAPGNQCDNKLEVAVDGLAQYFTDYHVAVYLDMPDANSWEGQSIRKVSLYIGSSATAYASYYVNDCAGSNFNGTYKRSEYTSAEDILADLAHNAAVLSGELTGEDAVLIDTTGNYVVFEVPAGVAADNFRVIIEDGYTLDNINGKDIPGIAAIQVKGTLHAQDVAASTDIAHGGADMVYTSGGDDIVVGGTGGDTLTTYGDERYGIYDNDVVFGDNAKMVFTDRDSSEATASTLSLAESLDSRTVAGDYNDHIYTGNGNDVVVGGQGADHIESGATAAAEAMLDGIQVASFNFTRENVTASEMVGETAGVVADNDWTNLYIKNNGLHVVGENYTNDPVTHDGIGISLVAYDTAVGNGTQNSSLIPKDDAQLDGDTSNSKLFNAYYAAQQQQEIKLTLTNLDSFADGASCDVYVYLGGDQQNTDTYNYLFDVWGHQVGGATPDRHYYLNDWTGSHFDGDYRRVKRETAPTAAELLSQVAPDMSLVGNYVVFRGVSSSTFEVRIRNLFTDTNQWPLNLPVITAVQVVAGENREEDIAVGGDHDKDLVFGDDARVTFDIDTPFARNENLADYANRAIEAECIHYDGAAVEIPLDENDEPVEMGDTISTGKDRDVIVGGDFGDTITMGDGDDVALGDNASLILEHNNPVGVFAPSVEIMLEQHTVTTSTPEVFLGNNDADADDIQDKFENGGVPGVTPETSENGATDTFTDTTDKDWTIQQEVTPGTISQTIDISSGAQVVNFVEGETVLLVSDTWPGNQWWHPNIVMVADGQGHSVPALEWEWDVNGTTMTATTQPGYYFTVDIPDTPNGDNRYEIRVTALTAGTAVISIGA